LGGCGRLFDGVATQTSLRAVLRERMAVALSDPRGTQEVNTIATRHYRHHMGSLAPIHQKGVP